MYRQERAAAQFISGKQGRNLRALRSALVDVVVVSWPAEAPRRERLMAEGRPRLLLLEDGNMPPAPTDCLEDWVRLPASDLDVQTRVDFLRARACAHRPVAPELDDFGVMRFGEGWVPLPPVEARLATAMVERFGAVVTRDALTRAGWPAGAPGRNALDVHVLRLRRRLQTLGLAIRTVRSRGYLLEEARPGEQTG